MRYEPNLRAGSGDLAVSGLRKKGGRRNEFGNCGLFIDCWIYRHII